MIGEILLWGFGPALAELVIVNLGQVAAGSFVALIVGPTIRNYLRTTNFRDIESGKPYEEFQSR